MKFYENPWGLFHMFILEGAQRKHAETGEQKSWTNLLCVKANQSGFFSASWEQREVSYWFEGRHLMCVTAHREPQWWAEFN